MSQIKTTEIEGDVAISRHVTTGGNATIQGNTTVKKNLKVEGWLYANNITGPDKGWFKNEKALLKAHPLPQPGWWALVGGGVPAKIYKSENGYWIDSGETFESVVVDVEGFEEQIAAAMPKTIKFESLDTMGYADATEMLLALFEEPLLHTRYAVTGPGTDDTAKIVGILDVFAASNVPGGICTVTQTLTTNIVFNPLTGKFESHNDTGIYRYARHLRIAGSDSIGVGVGEWTGWWYDDATAARRAHDHIFQPESPRGKERYGVITVPTDENEDKTDAVSVEPYADVADIRFHFSTSAGGGAHRVRLPEAQVSSGDDDPHVTGLFGQNAYNATVESILAKVDGKLKLHNFGIISIPLDKVGKFGDKPIGQVLSESDALKASQLLDAVDGGAGVTGSFSINHHHTVSKFDVMNLETGSVEMNGRQGKEYMFRCLYSDATNETVRFRIARVVLKKRTDGYVAIAPVTMRQIDFPLGEDLKIDLTTLATKKEAARTATDRAVELVRTLFAERGVWDFTAENYHTPVEAVESLQNDAQSIEPDDLLMLLDDQGKLRVYRYLGPDNLEVFNEDLWEEADLLLEINRALNQAQRAAEAAAAKGMAALASALFPDRKVWDFITTGHSTITAAINSLSAEEKRAVTKGCLALLTDADGILRVFRSTTGNIHFINDAASWEPVDLLSEISQKQVKPKVRVLHKRMISYYSRPGEVYSVVKRMRIPHAHPGDAFSLKGIVDPAKDAHDVIGGATMVLHGTADVKIDQLGQFGQAGDDRLVTSSLAYEKQTQTLRVLESVPDDYNGYLITISTDVFSADKEARFGMLSDSPYVPERKCHGGFNSKRELVEMYEDSASTPRRFYLKQWHPRRDGLVCLTAADLRRLLTRRDIEIEQLEYRRHRRYSLHWKSRSRQIIKEALLSIGHTEEEARALLTSDAWISKIDERYSGPHETIISSWRDMPYPECRKWFRIGKKPTETVTNAAQRYKFRLYAGRTYVRFRRRSGGQYSEWTYYWMTVPDTSKWPDLPDGVAAVALYIQGLPPHVMEHRHMW